MHKSTLQPLTSSETVKHNILGVVFLSSIKNWCYSSETQKQQLCFLSCEKSTQANQTFMSECELFSFLSFACQKM